jgi:hypothetical protein
VDDDKFRVGYGQIASEWTGGGRNQFYVVVFDGVHRREASPDLSAVTSGRVALLGLTMDALMAHGHWERHGRCPVDESVVRWPAYKEAVAPETFDVVDYSGVLRTATPEEIQKLPFREVVAPIRIENAFRALQDDAARWKPEYETLLPVSEDLTTAALFPEP